MPALTSREAIDLVFASKYIQLAAVRSACFRASSPSLFSTLFAAGTAMGNDAARRRGTGALRRELLNMFTGGVLEPPLEIDELVKDALIGCVPPPETEDETEDDKLPSSPGTPRKPRTTVSCTEGALGAGSHGFRGVIEVDQAKGDSILLDQHGQPALRRHPVSTVSGALCIQRPAPCGRTEEPQTG
mmetsp:Transcript_3718/g.10907  ORF Transcript_3718/g.10907 Transcript_3718/m.10907 type:complete len:187 (-) Transcript_3718:77-637(-)